MLWNSLPDSYKNEINIAKFKAKQQCVNYSRFNLILYIYIYILLGYFFCWFKLVFLYNKAM